MRRAAGIALLVGLRLALDTSRLVTVPRKYWNWEEAHSAAVGWYVWHAGLWDQILPLQYKSFCGGCSALAGVAAPLLGFGGDSFLHWKAIALVWTALTLVATFVAVDRTVGRPAAWAALVLLAVPPLGFSDIDLMLWGNHAESALLVAVAVALAARGRAFGLGLWVGLAIAFTRTTLYGALIVVPWQLWAHRADRRHVARLLGGLALGLLPAFVPAGRGDRGFYEMSPAANLLPHGLPFALERAGTLLVPGQMASRLYRTLDGMGPAAAVWLVGAAVAAVAAWRAGGRLWLALAGVFFVLYTISGFPVPRMGPQAGVINLRYHAPWLYLLLVLGGVGAGAAWGRSRAGRVVAGLVVAAMLAPSAWAWSRSLAGFRPAPDLGDIPAVFHPRFAWIAVWRFEPERLARAHADDARTEAWLRRMEGYRAAADVHGGTTSWADGFARVRGSDDAIEAFGQALTDPTASWQDIPAINASLRSRGAAAAPLGRGIAWNLGFGTLADREKKGVVSVVAAKRVVGQAVAVLRSGLAPDEPCWTCAAAGAAAIAACRQPDPAASGECLRASVAGLPDADEVLYGAAVWCVRPGYPRAECRGMGVGPAFDAGLADPMAGVDRSFLLLEPGTETLVAPGGKERGEGG